MEDYYTYRGILDGIGSLQEKRTTFTNSNFSSSSNTGTNGVFAARQINHGALNGWVVGAHREQSTTNSSASTSTSTHTDIQLTISFLKTGDKTHYDVYVPRRAMFEILKKGNDVGVVLSQGCILAVKNFTNGMELKEDYVEIPANHSNDSDSDVFTTMLFLFIGLPVFLMVVSAFFKAIIAVIGVVVLIGFVVLIGGYFKNISTFINSWYQQRSERIEKEKREKEEAKEKAKQLAKEKEKQRKDAWFNALASIGWNVANNSVIIIFFNNQKIITVSANMTLGKEQFKDVHADSRYYDEHQFKLYKSGANWHIAHCAGAPLETIIDGVKLSEPIIVTDGMIVSVGYSARRVEKLPITLKLG